MATSSTALVMREDTADVTVRLAIAGFLAGYTNPTRASYTTDLRIFTAWCYDHRLELLDVTRAHLELFARAMETDGKMRSTVARRISTLCSFYRYCHVEGNTTKNPAANVRRPKVDYESRTLGLDRNELGGLLVQAGLGTGRDHALVSLLAMNGLRISEALGADIEDLDTERGHRTLKILRNGVSDSGGLTTSGTLGRRRPRAPRAVGASTAFENRLTIAPPDGTLLVEVVGLDGVEGRCRRQTRNPREVTHGCCRLLLCVG